MTVPDPTAGACTCPAQWISSGGGHMCATPASPPAVAASTGTSEDVGLSEAATELAVRQWTIGFENLRAGDWEYLARWLAAREAAARAEERRVAVAALIMTGRHTTETANAALDQHAARIAREVRPCPRS